MLEKKEEIKGKEKLSSTPEKKENVKDVVKNMENVVDSESTGSLSRNEEIGGKGEEFKKATEEAKQEITRLKDEFQQKIRNVETQEGDMENVGEKHKAWVTERLNQWAQKHSNLAAGIEVTAAWVTAMGSVIGVMITSLELSEGNPIVGVIATAVASIAASAGIYWSMDKISDRMDARGRRELK